MGAIGTATSVEGENVLGLGHPDFSGAVRLPLTEATIVTTSGGLGPVKIGYMGRTAGAVIQDRAAGILAVIGLLPETVELTMEITETDRHVQERLTVQLAPLPDWIPFLTFIATVEGFARVMNRVGSGEAAWEWSVDVAGADQPIREEATEYSPTDIGATVAQAGRLSCRVGRREGGGRAHPARGDRAPLMLDTGSALDHPCSGTSAAVQQDQCSSAAGQAQQCSRTSAAVQQDSRTSAAGRTPAIPNAP